MRGTNTCEALHAIQPRYATETAIRFGNRNGRGYFAKLVHEEQRIIVNNAY